jgi:hypothetical protein
MIFACIGYKVKHIIPNIGNYSQKTSLRIKKFCVLGKNDGCWGETYKGVHQNP